MGQVSLPIRIALVGAMAFLALWMVALKPKAAAEAPAPPAPAAQAAPATPLGAATQDAKDAAAASEASAKAKQAAVPEPAPTPEATPVTRAPAAAVAAPPKAKPAAAPPVQPTVVALVGTGEDDAVAREIVSGLNGAKTFVIPIEELSRHRDLVGSVEIRQVPTILVIGRDRRAQRIEGLPDAAQVRQALAAARR